MQCDDGPRWSSRPVSEMFQSAQNKGENMMSTATLQPQSSKEEADIRALVESIHTAHHNKDAAAIVAPYAQDAVVCDLAPPLSHRALDPESKPAWLATREGPIARPPPALNITVTGHFA